MVSEPKKRMNALGVFVLALMACLALAAVAAAGAGATSIKPYFTKLPATFNVSGGQFGFKDGVDAIACSGEATGSGTLESETAGRATLELHGCKKGESTNCTSSGFSSGTIATKSLAMDLTKLPGGAGPAVVLAPLGSSNTVAEFSCGGSNVKWSGAILGKITSPGYNTMTGTLTIDFTEKYGHETYRGRHVQLQSSWNSGSLENVSIVYGTVNVKDLGGKGEFELLEADDGHPDLGFVAGFPATSWALAESQVVLRSETDTVTCTKPEGSGGGEFANSNSGALTLTLHNCTEEFGFNCTTAGQKTGTVKTESMPIGLTYLSNGAPGVALTANKTSGKVMQMTCGGFIPVVVKGGVLGSIPYPVLGGSGPWVESAMHSVKEGEKYVQQYGKTESGEAVSLQAEIAGGKAEPVSLEMTMGFGLGEFFSGYMLLRE